MDVETSIALHGTYFCWAFVKKNMTLVYTAVFKMDNQQGPVVEHIELYLTLCCSLDGTGLARMDTCVPMAQSPLRSPKTTMILLIGYNWLYPNTK